MLHHLFSQLSVSSGRLVAVGMLSLFAAGCAKAPQCRVACINDGLLFLTKGFSKSELDSVVVEEYSPPGIPHTTFILYNVVPWEGAFDGGQALVMSGYPGRQYRVSFPSTHDTFWIKDITVTGPESMYDDCDRDVRCYRPVAHYLLDGKLEYADVAILQKR